MALQCYLSSVFSCTICTTTAMSLWLFQACDWPVCSQLAVIAPPLGVECSLITWQPAHIVDWIISKDQWSVRDLFSKYPQEKALVRFSQNTQSSDINLVSDPNSQLHTTHLSNTEANVSAINKLLTITQQQPSWTKWLPWASLCCGCWEMNSGEQWLFVRPWE